MEEWTMISPSISYLFLLSFDALLNIPLNNKNYSCFVTDYVNSTEVTETPYPGVAATMSGLFSPKMTVTASLKQRKGSGDRFQPLSQKYFTDPSLVSWQDLLLFIFLFNWWFLFYFVFRSICFISWREKRMSWLTSDWDISDELTEIPWFSSSLTCQSVAPWHLWFYSFADFSAELATPKTPWCSWYPHTSQHNHLVIANTFLCGHFILPNFWIF